MKPLNDRIYAEKLHQPDQTAGGIAKISENDDRPHYIKLLDIGPDVKNTQLETGVIALCGKYSGIDVDLYGRLILLREGELLAIVPDEDRWHLTLIDGDCADILSLPCAPGALAQADSDGGGFVSVFDADTWALIENSKSEIMSDEFVTLTATRQRATGREELILWKVPTASLFKTDGQLSARAAKDEERGFGCLTIEKV